MEVFRAEFKGREDQIAASKEFPDQTPLEWAIRFVAASVLEQTERAHQLLAQDGGVPNDDAPMGWVTYPGLPSVSQRLRDQIERRWARSSQDSTIERVGKPAEGP